nr:hypothetical protein Iba_chr03dCG3160 [Ipomoea batatas]
MIVWSQALLHQKLSFRCPPECPLQCSGFQLQLLDLVFVPLMLRRGHDIDHASNVFKRFLDDSTSSPGVPNFSHNFSKFNNSTISDLILFFIASSVHAVIAEDVLLILSLLNSKRSSRKHSSPNQSATGFAQTSRRLVFRKLVATSRRLVCEIANRKPVATSHRTSCGCGEGPLPKSSLHVIAASPDLEKDSPVAVVDLGS